MLFRWPKKLFLLLFRLLYSHSQLVVKHLSTVTIKSLGLSGNYSEREVEIKVMQKDKEIEDLTLQLSKEQDAKIEAYLSAAVDSGKINATQKTAYCELAKKDFNQVKNIVDVIDTNPKTSLRDIESKTSLTAGRETWNYLKWMREDSAGLEQMRLNNPDAFDRLKNTL